MSDEKERAPLDPVNLRDMWGRQQLILNEVQRIYGAMHAGKKGHELPEDVAAAVRGLHDDVGQAADRCRDLYQAVLHAIGDPELVMPSRKDSVGFGGTEAPGA